MQRKKGAHDPGVVNTSKDNPIIMIGAGKAEHDYGHLFVYYIVDTTIKKCFIRIGAALSATDCSSIKANVPASKQYITW